MTSGKGSWGETVWSLHRRLDGGDLCSADLVARCLERIRALDPAINSFLHVAGDGILAEAMEIDRQRAAGQRLPPLAGIPIGVKDNIAVRGMPLTCGSRILADYRSPFDATAVERLKRAGMVVLGKTNMDEFAMGSSSENSAFGPVRNPLDPARVSGGSSGGSAAAVSAGMVPAALGSDTGGSVRQPAAFCGLVGLKPTYGRVSRYGLVAFASSLDQIGLITRDVRDAALLLTIMAGVDPRDSTSSDGEVPDYITALEKRPEGTVVGVAEEFFSAGLPDAIRERCESALDALRSLGAAIKAIRLPFLRYSLPAYYILCTAEASSNLARYDGVRYGTRDASGRTLPNLYRSTRSIGFGGEVKRRIMLGTYVLSKGYYEAYYLKAMRARAFFIAETRKIFEEVDLIVSPTTPTPAFPMGEKVQDPVEMYLSDVFTCLANLTGVPAISIPCGTVAGLPVGFQLMAPPFAEVMLLSWAHSLEAELRARGI